MAITLLEALKVAPPIAATLIEEFAATSDILRVLPFENVAGTGVHYNREDTLPGVGFRGLNEAYSESTGVLNPQSEALKFFGGDLDVDRAIVDMQGPQVRATHELMKAKALAHSWTKAFIKGDTTSNPKSFDGLQVRLTGTQLISNAAAGGALSLNKLDELIDTVDEPTHLIMNKQMRRRLTAAARNTSVGGFVTHDRDEFGRQMTMYSDLPILIADYDETGSNILPFSESSPDASTTASTSIYCVSLMPNKVVGLQGAVDGAYGISARDLGELETQPVFRTRMDWYTAIAVYHGRGAARLYGITDAAVTA